ncbi:MULTISPECIES: D-alanyl-D-alanine carboxypeptidase/D-alanyl-D-alanine-endopeptidase [unclassified Modicisalibacter]|uniref:D-alanyl-D-alanine carboxypeptidase/D-alanyl-D-alanine endopeptidase n=1 Tax=unclassified Modicisalibacter TaxID=2679913 RepID=UPI001CCB60F7|nr:MULTISPECIES: D-alanyl-D-alanine carboxypeptidase/D-alanyl-D-alanine-endopeptidase [unclassified Modicisalibacter]MBZ9559204.1 D-alanyl-D-alanine carboxypeptidase/D-alanyl-D-alanine-endopeptidase [Modicisalibacter sp. R2A 31.J]MBZ9576631.1 D-alanyl-D-alanine carboxypeptidase/D-alanyl-D-alanine-endopeptidase [Modicisalibacter sp. MOD 31.J]
MPRAFITVLCLLLMGGASSVLAAGFDHVARLADQGYRIGAQARLLDSGEVLAEIDPQRSLAPASVSKLYMAAAALDRWGPQHRFTSRLVSTGAVDSRGVLHGDLVFEGGGDPALVSEDLWRLIQRLRQQGVESVKGQLVVSQWRFGPVECVTTDRCRAESRADNAYSALLSAAAVNYGSWCLNVLPGHTVGGEARILSCDTVKPTTRIDNHVTTVAEGGDTRLDAERVTDAQGDVLVVRGKIAQGTYPRAIYRASSDPAEQTAQTLLAMLGRAGIEVSGGAAVSRTQPPVAATRLAAVDGKPLQELLLRTLNYSNNFMADTLSLDLVDTPRASLPEGGAAVAAFAESLPGHGPLTLKSGSGLTTENRTTAQGVNTLLAAMYQRPALFPTFVAGLQLPVNGPMRFIRRGDPLFQDHVMLKTGTLNQPFAVRALGGYFRTRSGRWGSFSVLVNGTASTPYLSWSKVLDPVAEDLAAMIRAY